MSEAKYYTPDISEFHVGFVYQWQSSIDEIWRDSEIKANADMKFLGEHLEQLRVKGLDHDDIVECGWGCHVEDLGYEIRTHYSLTGFLLFVTVQGNIEIQISGGYTRFYGTLLNISELRRLMRQLGITKTENVKP